VLFLQEALLMKLVKCVWMLKEEKEGEREFREDYNK
jgi:hypothetical protein